MSDDPIRRILSQMQSGPTVRPAKANRTFRLTEPLAGKFIAYCNWKGWLPGDVLDRFIAEFMEVAKEDLPSDEILDQHRVKRKSS